MIQNKQKEILYNEFISLLKQHRIKSGLTQVELSKILLKPQSYVSKYESGERRLDVIELKVICEALDTKFSTFIIELEKKLNET